MHPPPAGQGNHHPRTILRRFRVPVNDPSRAGREREADFPGKTPGKSRQGSGAGLGKLRLPPGEGTNPELAAGLRFPNGKQPLGSETRPIKYQTGLEELDVPLLTGKQPGKEGWSPEATEITFEVPPPQPGFSRLSLEHIKMVSFPAGGGKWGWKVELPGGRG